MVFVDSKHEYIEAFSHLIVASVLHFLELKSFDFPGHEEVYANNHPVDNIANSPTRLLVSL